VRADWPDMIRRAQSVLTCSVGGRELPRVRYGTERLDWGASAGPCRDCGVIAGELHVHGCAIERCPACEGQLGGCDCE